MGRNGGLHDAEIEALKRPISERNWSASDAALIKSADALVADVFIPDDIWAELSSHFTDRQCIDVTLIVGHFVMLAMFLNSVGVSIDP
jgi:4-carboxymuconolactone decarboxylase